MKQINMFMYDTIFSHDFQKICIKQIWWKKNVWCSDSSYLKMLVLNKSSLVCKYTEKKNNLDVFGFF